MSYISLAEKAIYITSRKFPASYITNYQTNKKAWEFHSHIKPEELAEISKGVNAYMEELSQKTPEEINLLYNQEQRQEAENHRLRLQEQERLRQARLFFNQPEAKADFNYWGKMPSWTTDEAVALLLDKDPRVVNWGNISPHATSMHKKPESFAKEYQDLRDLLIRKYGTNQHTVIAPSELIEWANSVALKAPEELQEMVLERGDQSKNWKTMYEELLQRNSECPSTIKNPQKTSSAYTKELDSKNKIIAAIVKKHYRFDPNAKKNATTSNVHTAIIECGLSLDEGTILRHLKEAFGLLPQNLEESI